VNRLTVIGRNPNATIFVEDHTIAKDHALIELDENMSNPKLIDRGSVSGCTVNGTKVAKSGE
jgi:pSer/pThr/pTyr-binding forkhead associated (FHA) protein